jgi:hypothetical protein
VSLHVCQALLRVMSIFSPGQGLRTCAKRTTGKQGLRYTPRPEAPHYYPATNQFPTFCNERNSV